VAELQARPNWQQIDFLSDLHLSPATPATLAALQRHLNSTSAQAVFLLGDIFEVWIGDDARRQPFELACVAMLRAASERLQLHFMVGNRDFLLGAEMLKDCGMQGLSDPTVLHAFDKHWLLTHGDALCLADTSYQAFRKQVRSAAWQNEFLARPIEQRHALARQMRDASQAAQANPMGDTEAVDLDASACVQWLRDSGCHTMIHGHTHRPAVHPLAAGLERQVLSDWDFDSLPCRGDLLRLSAAGLQRISLS
jgi:UDP-2,3-diacylglucosamine hydrolase